MDVNNWQICWKADTAKSNYVYSIGCSDLRSTSSWNANNNWNSNSNSNLNQWWMAFVKSFIFCFNSPPATSLAFDVYTLQNPNRLELSFCTYRPGFVSHFEILRFLRIILQQFYSIVEVQMNTRCATVDGNRMLTYKYCGIYGGIGWEGRLEVRTGSGYHRQIDRYGLNYILTSGSRFNTRVCAMLRRERACWSTLCLKWYSLPSLPANWK